MERSGYRARARRFNRVSSVRGQPALVRDAHETFRPLSGLLYLSVHWTLSCNCHIRFAVYLSATVIWILYAHARTDNCQTEPMQTLL